MIWINITNDQGELLERFQVLLEGDDTRENQIKTAAQVVDHVGRKFLTKE